MQAYTIVKRFLLVGLLGICLGLPSHARELHGRLGLGYNGQFSNVEQTNGTPGVSFKYGLTRDIALGLIFGLQTRDPANSVVALKFFKNIFYETTINFYFFLAGGLGKANAESGVEFQSGFGAEFFIPGIESLGFSTELGASLNNIGGDFAFKTIGISFLKAGIHFYL